MRRLALTLVTLGLLATPRLVRADASARLVYLRGPGAEQCPGEQAVRAAVRARLGYDPFFPWARDALFVEITRDVESFRAEIKLVDAENLQRGAREIAVHVEDCAAVIDALALTVSLTIDPTSVVGRTAAPLHTTPSPTAPAPTTPSPTTPAGFADHGRYDVSQEGVRFQVNLHPIESEGYGGTVYYSACPRALQWGTSVTDGEPIPPDTPVNPTSLVPYE